ncbi:MAG: hypothetical protein K1Y02_06780 [Candidatus Hydrogenedentes bacterium]|nr:hypothetical protein [Candidatus Hydrogenedentota bacterium]
MKPSVLLNLIQGELDLSEALCARADLEIVLPGETPSTESLAGVAIDSLKKRMTEALAGANGKALANVLRHVLDETLRLSFEGDFPEIPSVAWRPLREAIARIMREHGFMVTMLQSAFHQRLAERGLDFLVTSDDMLPQSRALIELAHQAQIPTLCRQHGIMCGTQLALHHGLRTKYVAVFSEREKEVHASFNFDMERIFVTGNPRWDRLCRPPLPHVRESARRAWGLDADRPVFVYAMTDASRICATAAKYPLHHIDNTAGVLQAFAESARKHPEWQFVIRPRPTPFSDIRPLQYLLSEATANGLSHIVVDRLPVYESLAAADVYLCTQSNIGIEAMLLGLPVINVDLEDAGACLYREGLGPLFRGEDAVLIASATGEIAECMEAVLTDEATRATLLKRRVDSVRRFNHSLDGRATERTVDLILRLLKEHGTSPCARTRSDSNRERARRAVALGEEQFGASKLGDALHSFAAATAVCPDCAEAWNDLGTVQCSLGETEKAWTSVHRAFHLDPFMESTRENLRALSKIRGNEAEAERLLMLFGIEVSTLSAGRGVCSSPAQ